MSKSQYLLKRHQTWYVVVEVPKGLRAVLKKRRLMRSLQTQSLDEAKQADVERRDDGWWITIHEGKTAAAARSIPLHSSADAIMGKRVATETPYALAELGEAGRSAVKIWFVATFGNNKPITKWPKQIRADYLAETGKDLGDYSVKSISAQVLDAFPLMRLWGTEKAKADWSTLMWLESDIVLTTIRELMKRGVPSLSVHDSLIVAASKKTLAMNLLERVFFGLTQVKPVLVANPA